MDGRVKSGQGERAPQRSWIALWLAVDGVASAGSKADNGSFAINRLATGAAGAAISAR